LSNWGWSLCGIGDFETQATKVETATGVGIRRGSHQGRTAATTKIAEGKAKGNGSAGVSNARIRGG